LERIQAANVIDLGEAVCVTEDDKGEVKLHQTHRTTDTGDEGNLRRVVMTNVKFKKQERLTRVEAATRLTEIAKALSHSATFELERDGETLELDVPEEVMLEFEVEIEDEETELEVEIKWASITDPATPTQQESPSWGIS
jgi:amphi-Trp domain-containing protein